MARQTVNELLPAIGATVMVRFESVSVPCLVLDARSCWGKEQLRVEPVRGLGQQWIELGRIAHVCDQAQTAFIHHELITA